MTIRRGRWRGDRAGEGRLACREGADSMHARCSMKLYPKEHARARPKEKR
jgi:hypothetical protein